jgi:hypothetical protein
MERMGVGRDVGWMEGVDEELTSEKRGGEKE